MSVTNLRLLSPEQWHESVTLSDIYQSRHDARRYTWETSAGIDPLSRRLAPVGAASTSFLIYSTTIDQETGRCCVDAGQTLCAFTSWQLGLFAA